MIALRAIVIGCTRTIADIGQAVRERMWRPAPDGQPRTMPARIVRWLALAFTLYLAGAILITLIGAIIAAGFWLLVGAAVAAALLICARRG